MGQYDTQQVCENGHQITDSYNQHPSHSKKYCDKCGEKTIIACLYCHAEIRGHYYAQGVFSSHSADVPSHCHNCGKPYPWTEKKTSIDKKVLKPKDSDPLTLVERICSRFQLVARQLRIRHANRSTLDIKDEYDVQDLLHSLFILFFDDIRPEEWTPSYAGKSSRMDFLLKCESIVVETKKTRNGLGEKEIGTQLMEDIQRYKKHPDCKTLVCFVYDPDGIVANPRGLEQDLSRDEDEFVVKVWVLPKGY